MTRRSEYLTPEIEVYAISMGKSLCEVSAGGTASSGGSTEDLDEIDFNWN